jgi:hypothetical protein
MGPTGYADPASYPGYLATTEQLYLQPLGFTGTVNALDMPELNSFDYGGANGSVEQGVNHIVSTVTDALDCSAGVCADPDGPLTLVAYSQSAVDVSLAEQQLAADGVQPNQLDIVLMGDTANAFTGFLETWAAPGSGGQLLDDIGWGNLVGVATPDEYFPTDVYTITGDFWGDYPNAAWDGTTIHTDYLGLPLQDITSAALTNVDGMTNYFSIDVPSGDVLTYAWDALMNIGAI